MSNNDLILSSTLQPGASIDGRSQKDWSVDWWKYIYSIPADENHPSYDQNGAKAGTDQAPPVFYFVGTFDESGEATRNVQIAPNEGYKYLFMPLINMQWDAVQLPGLTDAQVKGFTQALTDTGLAENGGSLFASIDGVAVGNLEAHRQISDVFDYTLPENNLLGVPAGTITGSFGDGFYLGINLAGLPPEEHTINFGGVFNFANLDIPEELGIEDLEDLFNEQFSQNFTYNISFKLNEIFGTNGKDTNAVRGTVGWDDINGLNGKDYIVALEGNDVLHGGNGIDTLIGTNPNILNPGLGEIDIFYGGNASDTFVLGDAQKVYYTGNQLSDYALIKDFKTKDIIQLKGNRCLYALSENYSLGGKSGTSILLANTCELIGFVEGVTGLTLASNDFRFVS